MRSLLAAILLMIAGLVYGQDKLTLTIDRTIIALGESVNLSLTLSGSTSADDIQLPSMQILQVTAGPYTSTSYEIINGKASSSVSWTYRLRAVKSGREQIGPVTIQVNGKPVTSNQVIVNVASGSSHGTGQGNGEGDSPDVFVRVAADKSEVYQGDQVTLTYRIYFAAQISQPEIVRLPAANGFWVEELTVPQKQTLKDEVVNGRAYKIGILRKAALFPTTTGELTVEPLVITTKVQRDPRRRSRDPFDIFNDPFFSLGRQLEQVEVASPSATVRVMPLPQADVPDGFSGAVGVYKIRASLDRPMAKTNEAVTLTVQIDGTGNIKTLPEPGITFPPDLERYDPKTTDQVRRDQQRISGWKRFEYVIIPRAPGAQTIPPIEYTFFDPSTRKYSTIITDALSLSVEKGEGVVSGTGISVATKRGVESIATDIAYIKTQSGHFVTPGRNPHQTVQFWLLTGTPWIALAAVLAFVRRRETTTSIRRQVRRAVKQARTELTHGEKKLKSGNLEAASRNVTLALQQVAGALMSDTNLDLLDETLPQRWADKGYDPALLDRMVRLERNSDLIRFAPALADKTAGTELLKNARMAVEEAGRIRVE